MPTSTDITDEFLEHISSNCGDIIGTESVKKTEFRITFPSNSWKVEWNKITSWLQSKNLYIKAHFPETKTTGHLWWKKYEVVINLVVGSYKVLDEAVVEQPMH